jgi:hypothetical protein
MPVSASRTALLARTRAVCSAQLSGLGAADDAGPGGGGGGGKRHRILFKGEEVMADDGETLRTGKSLIYSTVRVSMSDKVCFC